VSLKHVSGLDHSSAIERLETLSNAAFWTGYGQTEVAGWITLQRASERPGAAGSPVRGCSIRTVDDAGNDVPTGEVGEIVVQSPQVFRGYFKLTEVTARTLRSGWHHTGDLGHIDADGFLHYVGRKSEKELIKSGGENVYPVEVETVIRQMPGVTAVVVLGLADAKWGETVAAIVELAASVAYTAEEVKSFVAGRIARYKRPTRVGFVDLLPRTSAGTIDRQQARTGLSDVVFD
jgi:long-chain acyl-CoA synthetase